MPTKHGFTEKCYGCKYLSFCGHGYACTNEYYCNNADKKEITMTQKEKELSFIDISGRLYYGVICRIKNRDSNYKLVEINCANYSLSFVSCILPYSGYQTSVVDVKLDAVKPYLRPMSSMTEEEKEELDDLGLAYWDNGKYTDENGNTIIYGGKEFQLLPDIETYDWLNKKMFDYRGLIEKGLALEAPEGMYKID